jgi:beta-glucosidase
VYPPGIRQIVRWALPFKKPVLVTENGICTLDDTQRERFILRHLAEVAGAIQEGMPVIGYLYWSLLDNFEWAEGYGPRFGLIEMDYATQQRRIRPSAQRFAEICRSNRLLLAPQELLARP